MSEFTTKLLDESTFDDFARAVEKNKIWGGCWCLGFHLGPNGEVETGREKKLCRVREGRTHSALVYLEDAVVGWCLFGKTDELPRIKHRKHYESELETLPDWRITCFVVDKDFRRQGVANVALEAALAEIRNQGGGLVESYPEDTTDRKVSSSFLYNATVSLFERHGFSKVRRLGNNHWVVAKTIAPQ